MAAVASATISFKPGVFRMSDVLEPAPAGWA
jgi:hypothetical protein